MLLTFYDCTINAALFEEFYRICERAAAAGFPACEKTVLSLKITDPWPLKAVDWRPWGTFFWNVCSAKFFPILGREEIADLCMARGIGGCIAFCRGQKNKNKKKTKTNHYY